MFSSRIGPGKLLHLTSVKALNFMACNVPIQFPFSLFKMQLQKSFLFFFFWLLPIFNPLK